MKSKGEGKWLRKFLSFTKSFIVLSVILGSEALTNLSCTKSGEFTVGKDFIDAETNVAIVDTFKTDVSTIFLDSVRSSQTGLGYVGFYRDTVLGSINCESYFDLKYSEFTAPGDRASFDSASFIFTYSKASYGDTTSAISIEIHQLSSMIAVYTDGYLYNTSQISYSPVAVGRKTFYPNPNSADTLLKIPVNGFGEELFTLIKNGDERLSSAELFNDYIKGFVLIPDSTQGNSVIGLKADNNHVLLKIYYHFEDVGPVEKEISINMGDAAHQFNRVRSDFSGTPLDGIKTSHRVSSVNTYNRAYMQGLVGLVPKIQFPTLQNLFLSSQWKILRSELIAAPVANSFDVFKLPTKMYIYDTNKSNVILNILTDSKNVPLVATFNYDNLYNEDTRYTYDISNFINAEISDMFFDYNHALAIGLSESGLKSSLDRLIVECKNPPVKLRVFYLSY
jgi:hypothetical protein